MKVGAVAAKKDSLNRLSSNNEFINLITSWMIKAYENNIDILVLPGLSGCIFGDARDYIESILRISVLFKDTAICPGSFFETCGDKTYHSSCIIQNGRILLRQRQLYLAKWERDLGLSRGDDIGFVNIKEFKTAILIGTDAFYPQVSRYAAMSGAQLVVSPMAIIKGKNLAFQLSALWQNVQQNLFFGVESGFKGNFKGNEFYSLSAVHAPLEMTEKENGFLEIEKNNECEILTAELDNKKRMEAVNKFNVFRQLNIEFYKEIFR